MTEKAGPMIICSGKEACKRHVKKSKIFQENA
jgi:hypothetical protein